MADSQPIQPGFDISEPKVRIIAVFGVLTIVGLIAIILGLQAYVESHREHQIFVKQLEPVSEDLRALRVREDTELNSYQFIDREKGLVRLPIRRAMELMLAENGGINAAE